MDQSRGLKGLARLLSRHAGGGEFPQLVVDERKQVRGRVPVPGRGGVE